MLVTTEPESVVAHVEVLPDSVSEVEAKKLEPSCLMNMFVCLIKSSSGTTFSEMDAFSLSEERRVIIWLELKLVAALALVISREPFNTYALLASVFW